MIDVKKTILATINDKMKKMRFLGENDPKGLKTILALIVLDDLYDWSDYLEDPSPLQKKLQDLRTQFILCQHVFKIQHTQANGFYVNVNTPQTSHTWKRVWDAPDLINLEDSYIPVINSGSGCEPFIPDPTCPVSIVYFDNYDEHGNPDIDIASLTLCEKMNIYVNRETGQMFYLDPDTCTWKTLKGEAVGNVKWNSIIDKPSIYGNLKHNLQPEDSKFNVSLNEMVQDEAGHWIVGPDEISDDVAITGEDESIDDVL